MKKNNQAIMASAGTGKTYNLAMRYLRLMQEGASPASIVALTFSNKAAGEILDKIITVLLELTEKEEARQQAIEAGFILPGSNAEDFRKLLHALLSCRERLQISTIDSFFMQILQAFPMECGIAGNITMIDEEDDRPRLQALLKLFASADEAKRRELLEHLKDISFGNDEKSMNKLMTDFLHYTYPIYLDNPDPLLWGKISTIWKEYDPSWILSEKELKKVANELPLLLIINKIEDKRFRQKFTDLAEMAEKYARVRLINKPAVEQLIVKPFKDHPEALYLDQQEIVLNFNRKEYPLESRLANALRKLVRHLLTVEFHYITSRTRALYNIFADFDRSYAATARNAGLLTFNDVACLIRGNSPTALPCSDLITLEERIDAKTDHYMLDEFQDTSNRQWEILANLADEAINNYTGDRDRSFFFVGDIKQSIYQWRQGNPKLFGLICREHGFTPDGKNGNLLSTLERSFRSSVPVINTVNKVFQTECFPVADQNGLLRMALEGMQFKTHSSAPSAAAQAGCTMMFEMKEKDFYAKARSVANLIKKLDPFSSDRRKPLSVGILVRTNETGRKLADILIYEGLNVTVDGKLDPAQSLAFTTYRQLLRLAAHPEDKMAQGFLEMLVFGEQKIALPNAQEVRGIISQQGFHAFTRRFFQLFNGMTAFDRTRMEVVEKAALRADQQENRTIDEFLSELDLLKDSGSSNRNTVQIMTIHKSKGLDFDIVILPETSWHQGNMIKHKQGNAIAVMKDHTGIKTQWISFLPNAAFIPLLPEVQFFVDYADFSACYENLCNLYVAMTRARNALYIFNDPPPEKTTTVQYSDFLRTALIGKSDPAIVDQAEVFAETIENIDSVSYACGDPQWYQQQEKVEKEKVLTPSQLAAKQEHDFRAVLHTESRIETIIPAERPCRIRPSATHEAEQAYIFCERKAANLGTRLHDILAAFEFYTGEADVCDFLQNHCTAPEEVRLLTSFFQSEEIRNILRKPEGKHTLWREKRFLSSLGNGIVNGCFDRVLIRYAEDGTPADAEILDYKSDRDVTPEILQERHAPQLDLYRKVLAKLTGLSVEKIRCTLLSVRYGFAVSF